MLKIFLFFFLFLLPLHAEDLQRQRLAWQMEGGDVRNIAGLCRQYVQKKFEAQKTFSVEALLQDRDRQLQLVEAFPRNSGRLAHRARAQQVWLQAVSAVVGPRFQALGGCWYLLTQAGRQAFLRMD